MLKKVIIYVLTIFSITTTPVDNNIEYLNADIAILQIFENSGSTVEYYNTNSYLIYEKEFITIDMGEKICDDIAEKLNLYSIIKQKEETDTYRSVVLKGTTKNNDEITVILQSSSSKTVKETIITLDCIGSTLTEYKTTNEDIRTALDKLGNATHNTVIVGYKDIGSFDSMTDKAYIDKLLNTVDGKEVESYRQDNVVSVTAYTDRVKEHLEYFDRKANINIAIRKDSYNNKSYLYLASPIINIEY